MSKIPVIATVSRTYGFLLGEIGTIIRLSWAPLLIAAGLNYLYAGQTIDAAIQSSGTGMPQMNVPLAIVGFLANVMVIVALLRVVMFGDRKTGLVVYLWFGAAEIRLVLVYVLLTIAIIAGVIGVGIAFGIVAAIIKNIPGGEVVISFAAIALMLGVVGAALKLTLLPAVVVAENSLGVERAWALMRGNALRMFFVLLLTYIPIGIVGAMLSFAILGSDFPSFPDFHLMTEGKMAPDAVRAAIEQWQIGLLTAIRKHWFEFSLLNFGGAIVSAALVAGIAGNAYNSLAGERA